MECDSRGARGSSSRALISYPPSLAGWTIVRYQFFAFYLSTIVRGELRSFRPRRRGHSAFCFKAFEDLWCTLVNENFKPVIIMEWSYSCSYSTLSLSHVSQSMYSVFLETTLSNLFHLENSVSQGYYLVWLFFDVNLVIPVMCSFTFAVFYL